MDRQLIDRENLVKVFWEKQQEIVHFRGGYSFCDPEEQKMWQLYQSVIDTINDMPEESLDLKDVPTSDLVDELMICGEK